MQLTLRNPIIMIDSHWKCVIAAALLKSFVEGNTITQCQGYITRLWKREKDEFVSIITWIKLMKFMLDSRVDTKMRRKKQNK